MSFPRYPKYKDSGVEWLGEVPEHWSTSRVRWLCQRYAGGTPDKTKTEYWENGTIPWLNSGAVNDRLITEPSALITDDAFANSSAKWIPRGALLMALAGQGKTKGMVAQLAFRATCNQSMAALVPETKIDARYLYYWLDSNYQNIRNMAGGDLRDGLNLELIGNIPCPLPAIPEQAAIASFLDRETAKIDALIAEQQRLIELLQEKRQAVISHAVTKGLNPDAAMKDSGIEWLGQVPEHWSVNRLSFIADIIAGYPFDSALFGFEGTPVIRMSDFGEGQIDIDNAKRVEACHVPARSVARSGDCLLGLSGSIGNFAVIPEECEPVAINQRVAVIRADQTAQKWLRWFLESEACFQQLTADLPETTIQNVSMSQLRQCRIPMPPEDERVKLVTLIQEAIQSLDGLDTQAQSAIALLQERRSALISAAVTGQIDVRGLAGSEAA